jgi:fatty-acyl-CoA synthase
VSVAGSATGVTGTLPASSFTHLSPLLFLQRSAHVYRDQAATVFEGRTTTYAELLARVERLAGALRERGVEPGDRVAALLPNVPAMLELHFAVPGGGAVLVPINGRLGPEELTYILDHSGASVLFVHDSLLATARQVLEALGTHLHTVVVGGDDDDYESMVTNGPQVPLHAAAEDDLLSINYTSGTTSSPKGVMYVHRGAYLHALGVIAESGLDASSRYLWTLPMFHCNGWAYTWAVTAMGGRHICMDRFDAELAWGLIREHSVTHLCGAPTVVTMLAEADAAAPLDTPVKTFVGGAPPSPALMERASGLGFAMTQLYGLTETYGPLCVCAPQQAWDGLSADRLAALQARQGVGTVVSDRLRVVDPELNDVPADGETLGEVVMRGNNVTIGYYRAPEITAEAFAGGWFHSGDLGVMHPDGYIELRDRAKDVIISGGENISTIEVEHALASHPAVVEAAVVGVPDDRWGEVPKAFVVTRGDAAPSAEELRDWVRARLARYKAPKEVEFIDELPKTATNKVQKFVLRERAAAQEPSDSGVPEMP